MSFSLVNALGNILAREEDIRSFAAHFCSTTLSDITADIDKLLTEPFLNHFYETQALG